MIRSFALALLAAAAYAADAPAHAQQTTLRIESSVRAAHPSSRAMEVFKDEVGRLTGGAVDVVLEPGSRRSFKELIDSVHVGRMFAAWMSVRDFSKLAPEISAISLPFAFDNYDQARRAIAGPVGTVITAKLEAKGFIVLAWMELGALQVANSTRPLKTLDDFKGLKIRVLPNVTHVATFQALGARPVVIALTEVAAASRQGDIDGQEVDHANFLANKFYEHQKYLSDTGHFMEFHVLITDERTFAGLDPVQQKAVRQAAAIAAAQQHEISMEVQAAAFRQLQHSGVQFDPLSRETRVALRQATAGVIDDVRRWVGARRRERGPRSGRSRRQSARSIGTGRTGGQAAMPDTPMRRRPCLMLCFGPKLPLQ